jgi:hypothetical protein
MTITEMVRQGLHDARTCKSLWLFGFFVALTGGGSSGGGTGGDGGGTSIGIAGISSSVTSLVVVPLVIAIAAAVIAGFVLRFISEGALIEGIVRARQGARMSTGEAFRAGLRHWGVLLRIGMVYVVLTVLSLVAIAVPGLVIVRAAGLAGGIVFAIPVLVVAIPWLVTLYLVQAFALRIAVLENRKAIDAIRKARLFLHGRVRHGLRLILASFVGTFVLTFVGILVILPIVIACVVLLRVLPALPVIALGGLMVLPAIYILIAMTGTLRSSIWTTGYLTEAES